MALRDAAGLVVDSLNYGRVVDPWAAEGLSRRFSRKRVQRTCAGARRRRRSGRTGAAAATARSAGRFPDGADTDSNCRDFLLQTVTILPTASTSGANNIKVASVSDFDVGQTVIIDTGENRETAAIAKVGTPGGTTVGTATEVGATAIPVGSSAGFSAGQTITIDSGANRESAVVASVTGGGRGGFGGRGGAGPGTITVTAPLS